MDADSVVNGIKGCSAFFASQGSLVTEEAKHASLKAMGVSLQTQIAGLPVLTIADAARINHAIVDSAFSQAMQTILAEATVARVASYQAVQPRRKSPQTLHRVGRYLTASDWAVLDDGAASLGQKLCQLMDRLFLMGLSHPSEDTIKHIAAILICVYCPTGTATQMHSVVLDIKTAATSRKSFVSPLHHLLVYPIDPKDLPPPHYAAAYPEDDGPIDREPAQFHLVLARVPLRNSNQALGRGCGGGGGGGGGAGGGGGDSSTDMLQQLQKNMMMMQQFHQSMCGGHAAAAPLQLHYTQPWGSPTSAAASALLSRSSSSDSLLWPGSPADRAVPRDSPPGHMATNARPTINDARATPPPRAALALGDQALGDGDVGASSTAADDLIKRLESLAATAGSDQTVGESKANAKKPKPTPQSASAKPTATTKAAKPEAKANPKAKSKASKPKVTTKAAKPEAKAVKPKANLQLGCGKCRKAKNGCSQCRDPNFGGERGHG